MKFLKFTVVIILLSLFIVTGCKKDDGDDDVVPKYLVDFELYTPSVSYTADNLRFLLGQFGLSSFANQIKYEITINKIRYKTLFNGDTIIASGIVATPVAVEKKQSFPILSYQHGTLFQKSEGPSVNPTNEIMTYMASTGMVVVIADYIGFGASSAEFHPYMHNEYTVNAVLDMIRASKEFLKSENPCNINDQLFMLGYSQGGSATVGALSAIENNVNNSDITVTAASAGGGAYDLTGLRDWIMNQQRYEQPAFMAYILESYSRYSNLGSNFDFSLVFSNELPVEVKGLVDGFVAQTAVNSSFKTTYNDELFNDNFENDSIFANDPVYASMRQAFNMNKISAWPLTAKLRLYHGNDDIWVPVDQSSQLFQEFKNQGSSARVSLNLLPSMDHSEAAIPTVTESINWFLSIGE